MVRHKDPETLMIVSRHYYQGTAVTLCVANKDRLLRVVVSNVGARLQFTATLIPDGHGTTQRA